MVADSGLRKDDDVGKDVIMLNDVREISVAFSANILKWGFGRNSKFQSLIINDAVIHFRLQPFDAFIVSSYDNCVRVR